MRRGFRCTHGRRNQRHPVRSSFAHCRALLRCRHGRRRSIGRCHAGNSYGERLLPWIEYLGRCSC